MNSESLRGRVVVVPGASSGIGAAVARALAREGVHVALAAPEGRATGGAGRARPSGR